MKLDRLMEILAAGVERLQGSELVEERIGHAIFVIDENGNVAWITNYEVDALLTAMENWCAERRLEQELEPPPVKPSVQ